MIGNLAPDCNKNDENDKGFTPPKKITHWLDDYNKANAEAFYSEYTINKETKDEKERAFLVGYYVHLLSDVVCWVYIINEKLGKDIFKELKVNEQIRIEFHKDWQQHDQDYFSTHPDFSYYFLLEKSDCIKIYLDYYNQKDFEEKVIHILE